jgi:hypothetical protein
MLPETVRFTDLSLAPRDILTPRKKFDGAYPLDWVRHQFSREYDGRANLKTLDAWLEKNITGRWGSYSQYTGGSIQFVILFEQINDGLMFKLMDGENEAFSGRENYF